MDSKTSKKKSKLDICPSNSTYSSHPSNTWKLCVSTRKVWQWLHTDGPSWRPFYCSSTQRPCHSL